MADVCESLIGAAYLSAGSDIDGAIIGAHTLKIPISGMNKWSDVVTFTQARNARIKAAAEQALGGVGRVPPLSALGWDFNVPQNGRDALVSGRQTV